jgi:superfamily II DNA/RNA helicase
MPFRDLGLSGLVLRAVAAQGHATPTPIESEAISPLPAGRDALGTVQSGTVKSALVQNGIGENCD